MFCQGYGLEDYAQEAYNPIDKREPVVDGYNYKPDLSTPDVAVYEDPLSQQAKVAFRGTSKVRDINPDIGIAGNVFKSTDRYKSDKAQLEKIIMRYGPQNLHLLGHSLAGRSASTLAQDYSLKADTFNEGSSPLQMKQDLERILRCTLFPSQTMCVNAKKITKHLIPGDPVSAWNVFTPSNIVYHKPKGFNLHSLKNFKKIKKNLLNIEKDGMRTIRKK